MSTNTSSGASASTLSATASVYNPLAARESEFARLQAHLASLQATARRDMQLTLSEESSSEDMERFLATKRQDRHLAIHNSCIEEQDRVIQQVEEWAEIEVILEIGREGFRAEMEFYGLQLRHPIFRNPGVIGQERQFGNIEEGSETFGERVEVSDDVKIEYDRVQLRKILADEMKVKLAEGIARRARLRRWLSPIIEEEEAGTC